MDLDIFYTALATVAATLVGLLFTAIQQNAERLSDPHNRWRAIAVSTFYYSTYLQGGKGTEASESSIAAIFIALLVNVLRNSWRLLVEIPSED